MVMGAAEVTLRQPLSGDGSKFFAPDDAVVDVHGSMLGRSLAGVKQPQACKRSALQRH